MILKAYKVLKLYPSLDEKVQIGDLVNIRDLGFGVKGYCPIKDNYSSYSYNISSKEVENNPDFFQKIEVEVKIKVNEI